MVLTAVSFLALSAPAWGQSDIGNDPSSFGNGIPDLIELFRARPPMGECPVGATDDHGPLPEASHLLHLGVPRFYRDYRRRLQLSADQVKALKTTQEAALAAWYSQQEKIDNLELQVWVLTGDPTFRDEQLVGLLQDLESARASQRLDYIRAVRDAAGMLTSEQQRRLRGI